MSQWVLVVHIVLGNVITMDAGSKLQCENMKAQLLQGATFYELRAQHAGYFAVCVERDPKLVSKERE